MSGHSKWATITHKKAATDAKRGRMWTKIIKEIQVAARMGGGDVNANPRLRKAVALAKANAMNADNITRAIKRGTGELEGSTYEEATYEGTGAGGTLFIVEALTDNKNRTVAELRKIFEKAGASLGTSGTAGWAFDRKGLISIARAAADEDKLMDLAVGAGADDYVDEGDTWQITTPPDQLDTVAKALEAASIVATEQKLGWVPKNKKEVAGRDAELCMKLADQLDDHDDVQNVYTDFELSDEEAARLGEA
ncbi:MAG: YebC/PmpR family DNA-binding transcriptional regulator [Deltaproteobacteria bacterium]|nr:YebC/PmpR family DNA-binding transcriptional regulator [Deltaproteobacteria bacterium]